MIRNSIGMPAVGRSPVSGTSAIAESSRSGMLAARAVRRGVAALALAACAALLGLTAGPAAADDPRQNEPGKFDFYVLALSWSPSYCDSLGERAQQQAECGERPYAFIVHGLWPQYEEGFPEFCKVPA